jgi:hypothetical protein
MRDGPLSVHASLVRQDAAPGLHHPAAVAAAQRGEITHLTYAVDDAARILCVVVIGHRREVYRGLDL